MIIEVESEWRETGIPCPRCEMMTYSDGIHRPTCGNEGCLRELSDEEIWTWLITVHEEPQPSSVCIWQRRIDDDGYVHFDTSCHYGFGLDVIGNGPLSNHWFYCPLCGLKLEIKLEIGK